MFFPQTQYFNVLTGDFCLRIIFQKKIPFLCFVSNFFVVGFFLHFKDFKFPDGETINKLINSYEEVYFITNISNKENFEKIKNSYERYKTSQTKLLIFNSTPYVTRNEPFKCFIQRKDCFVEKDKNISERKLDNLFENFIEYKSKNLNNFFIFNSFGSLCNSNSHG